MEDAEQHLQTGSPENSAEPQELVRLAMPQTMGVCAAALFIPGLGHLLLRRWVRGLILSVCVLAMFLMGLAMEGKLYDRNFEQPLHVFAFLANIGAGLPYIIASQLGLGTGTMTASTYDYGTTFLWVSGLLNYLIILDAFDISQGRKP